MGAAIRAKDWSETPVGPVEQWPVRLLSTVELLLNSRNPMFLWWGPELIQFYNDAYVPSFGRGKHPAALGQRGRDCWDEIWPIIGPQIDGVLRDAAATWNEDALVPIYRNDRIEEVYWTYGYSPVFDEGGSVAGVLVVCTETTSRVVAIRRQRLLRIVAERVSMATRSGGVVRRAFDCFSTCAEDIPFAVAISASETLPFAVGLGPVHRDAIAQRVRSSGRVAAPRRLALEHAVTPSPPVEPVHQVFVVPLKSGDLFAFGLRARVPFDEAYRGFLVRLTEYIELVHDRMTAAARHVRAEEVALAELEEASRAKDEFLAMLGHELRNPLAPIVTALDLLALRGDEGPGSELRVIRNQVSHVIRLVDDLLDVSKIIRGKVALRKEVFDIRDAVAQAIEIAGNVLEERGHRLHVETPTDPLAWWGDRVRVAQVVANLLTNAGRYTSAGGDITLAVARERDEIVVRVSDNGIGIAPELLPEIFDLFVQGARSSDRAQGGLGIGLALVKSLTELHGGTAAATSAGLGCGSEFTIRLPAGARPTKPPPGRPVEQGRSAKPKRILLVDDNLDATEMLAALLQAKGHEVAVAHDGVVGLESFESFRPDVAVLDIGLPVMDGYELARRIIAAGGKETCRLIAVTGYGQPSDRARSAEAGFDVHLVKPVDLDELLEALGAT